MKTCLLCLALLIAAASANADVYRWVDAKGRVQYSDQAPAGVNAAKLMAKSATGTAGPTVKTYQEQDQDLRKRRVEEEEKAKKDADATQLAQAKQQNCAQAKRQVASLQTGGRFTTVNSKGEREYLDDKAIAVAVDDAKKAEADWCK